MPPFLSRATILSERRAVAAVFDKSLEEIA
jgi:hypothetical protein